jgi:hypothetical protein
MARLIGQWLSDRLGQQFVIENRPGAASNLAAEIVVRAPADGYTLLLVTSVNAINATLYDNLNLDLIHDIVPVARIARGPGVMEVNPTFPNDPHRRSCGGPLCFDFVDRSSPRTIADHASNCTSPTHQLDRRAGIHHQRNRVEGPKCTEGKT